MAFDVSLEMTPNEVAKITLVGELDASVAQQFRDEVDRAASLGAKRLVLLVDGLDYMASAGLRSLIFAKQKMGPGVEIYVIGAQPPIVDTLTMTGFHHSVIMLDQYDAATLENL